MDGGVHSRLPVGYEETFVYVDAESFLFGMVKIGAMKIEKWEWEPSGHSSSKGL